MKNVIEKAIEALANKAGEALEPHHAMQFAQAALNLAHTQQVANLVAAAEREECAKVCEEVGNQDKDCHAWDAAAAIRARSKE